MTAPSTIPRDAQARLMLAAAMRGHRVASPGRLYADVDGEVLRAVRRAIVWVTREVGGPGESVPAIYLASAEPGTDPDHVRSIRVAGHDEWSLTPVEARA